VERADRIFGAAAFAEAFADFDVKRARTARDDLAALDVSFNGRYSRQTRGGGKLRLKAVR